MIRDAIITLPGNAFYHMSMMGENVLSQIENNRAWIGYLHAADLPGRHQPGTGEIDYRSIASVVKRSGYSGFIGMEFSPLGSHEEAARASLEVFV